MERSRSSKPTRRVVMQHLAGGATAGIIASMSADRGRAAAPASATASAPASAPSDAISESDVAAVQRVIGRNYSEDERRMVVGSLTSRRQVLRSVREREIAPEVEPAVHFDPLLPGMSLPSGPSGCVMSGGTTLAYDGNVERLAFATVVELSRLIHDRKVSSVELTKMYLDRLNRFGGRLNCVITLTEDLALKQAERADRELSGGRDRGALHGIPWGAKDLLATKRIPTSWGVSPYRDRIFDEDATLVKRLEEAGAVLLAKLSLGELAMGDIWFNGMTRNPWNPAEGSQGSSAGSAAATAGGLVGFSIGSETLGSIVSPCVACGTTGLRPTYGRVSRFGAMPLARTMDKLGPITRGVEDCALVLSAIMGSDARDPSARDSPFNWSPDVALAGLKSIRLGVDMAALDLESDEWRKKEARHYYQRMIDKLCSMLGVDRLRPVHLPPAGPYTGIAGLTIASESACNFTELVESGRIRELRQQDAGSWPNTFRSGSMIPASDYLRAQQIRTLLQREIARAMEDAGVDAFITLPFTGPQSAYTNLTGHPSVVTRCAIDEQTHRPRMVEFIGSLYGEEQILLLAWAWERANDFTGRWPDMSSLARPGDGTGGGG